MASKLSQAHHSSRIFVTMMVLTSASVFHIIFSEFESFSISLHTLSII